jgi:hypothetical protein
VTAGRRRGALLAAAALVVVAAAFVGARQLHRFDRRDGARRPDIEGVLSDVTPDHVVINGRTVPLAAQALSFSTYTHQPVTPRPGTYVQAGLSGAGKVQWLATIGVVAATTPPRVRSTGVVAKVSGGRATFKDGTVLRVRSDLVSRLPHSFVAVEIDPSLMQVVAFS